MFHLFSTKMLTDLPDTWSYKCPYFVTKFYLHISKRKDTANQLSVKYLNWKLSRDELRWRCLISMHFSTPNTAIISIVY